MKFSKSWSRISHRIENSIHLGKVNIFFSHEKIINRSMPIFHESLQKLENNSENEAIDMRALSLNVVGDVYGHLKHCH